MEHPLGVLDMLAELSNTDPTNPLVDLEGLNLIKTGYVRTAWPIA
jgi:hypothetical protein